LVTINPGLIVGPIIHGSFCTSMDLFKKLLEREMPVIPDISIPLTDVRDVALAHIKAMVSDKAVSKRFAFRVLLTFTNKTKIYTISDILLPV
jgi:dihydroflavonol-4-reductase